MPSAVSPLPTPATPADPDDVPDRIGKYRVVRALSHGLESQVLLAEVEGIGGVPRRVVIKRVRPGLARTGRAARGFLHEERVTSALHHPNLVSLLDSADTPHGYAMVLEYLRGWDLRAVIRRLVDAGEVMPPDVAVTIAHAAASGLGYLHALSLADGSRPGLVHHDVRPSNVMVTADGFVKLIDLGDVTIEGMERAGGAAAADAAADADAAAPDTAAADETAAYTAPEVLARAPATRRSDLYSLGVMLYELTCGRRFERSPAPPAGDDADDDTTVVEAADGPARSDVIAPSALRPGYPEDVEALVMRLVEPDPQARFATADALIYAVETLAERRRWSLSARRVAVFLRELLGARVTLDDAHTAPEDTVTRPIVIPPVAPDSDPDPDHDSALAPAPALTLDAQARRLRSRARTGAHSPLTDLPTRVRD